MDPTAAYASMIEAVRTGDHREAAEISAELSRWLHNGGFPPGGWDRDTVLAVCRGVREEAARRGVCLELD